MMNHDDKQPSKKPLIYYYFIVILVVMLLNALLFPSILQSRVKEVGYSTFLEMVDSGVVTQVAMEETDNQIVFTTEDNGQIHYYKTGIFPDDGLRGRLEAPAWNFVQKYRYRIHLC